MKKKIFITVLALASMLGIRAQKTENIVVVTMDGLRWQEIFGGADSLLSFAKEVPYSTGYVQQHFWAPTVSERRQKLMPFFWNVIAKKGSCWATGILATTLIMPILTGSLTRGIMKSSLVILILRSIQTIRFPIRMKMFLNS